MRLGRFRSRGTATPWESHESVRFVTPVLAEAPGLASAPMSHPRATSERSGDRDLVESAIC